MIIVIGMINISKKNHDSDMGSTEESYPNGTYYYCSFQGNGRITGE